MNTKLLNILLVDDDDNDCAYFGMAINEAGLSIILQIVADGKQAIAYLEGRGVYSHRLLHPMPDLVVLDLDTRVTGALDFLDWHRASASLASLPVVLFSAFAYKGTIEIALAMGHNTFVPKPLEFEGWEAAVQQICAGGVGRSKAAMKPAFAMIG